MPADLVRAINLQQIVNNCLKTPIFEEKRVVLWLWTSAQNQNMNKVLVLIKNGFPVPSRHRWMRLDRFLNVSDTIPEMKKAS